MNFIESCKFILRSLALAALATLFVLICLEWLMPGSVLPFLNLIVIAPAIAFFGLLVILGANWNVGINNLIQIGIGLGIGLLILAFLASVVGYSSLSQLGLLGAMLGCLMAWIIVQFAVEFHK